MHPLLQDLPHFLALAEHREKAFEGSECLRVLKALGEGEGWSEWGWIYRLGSLSVDSPSISYLTYHLHIKNLNYSVENITPEVRRKADPLRWLRLLLRDAHPCPSQIWSEFSPFSLLCLWPSLQRFAFRLCQRFSLFCLCFWPSSHSSDLRCAAKLV